jgi:hypothetical protein
VYGTYHEPQVDTVVSNFATFVPQSNIHGDTVQRKLSDDLRSEIAANFLKLCIYLHVGQTEKSGKRKLFRFMSVSTF